MHIKSNYLGGDSRLYLQSANGPIERLTLYLLTIALLQEQPMPYGDAAARVRSRVAGDRT